MAIRKLQLVIFSNYLLQLALLIHHPYILLTFLPFLLMFKLTEGGFPNHCWEVNALWLCCHSNWASVRALSTSDTLLSSLYVRSFPTRYPSCQIQSFEIGGSGKIFTWSSLRYFSGSIFILYLYIYLTLCMVWCSRKLQYHIFQQGRVV